MAEDTRDPITPAGHRKLREELERLYKVERPRVTKEVADAAALGDRSENAEYIYGKKRLREIDKRLEYLSKRLDRVRVVHPGAGTPKTVQFGCLVEVEDDDGERVTYQIVGTDESDADTGKISIASPIARALLNRAVDDEVEVKRPRGDTSLVIVSIRWPRADVTNP
jgi:transcription elongation factor GreB